MKPRCHLLWLPGYLPAFWLATTSPLQAQIVQDATLPNPSSVIVNGNTSIITGGTQAGSNLFHSFREFSVPTAGIASFQQIDQGIQNVISRVTGSSLSSINGRIELLQANGTVSPANFFLLNPNGIIFGPNASLNVGGSFLASTATSLNFADGTSFSATNPQTTAPLLTVSVPIGLQFARPAAGIQLQGAGLIVPPGKTLGLVGGNLTLVRGVLGAAGGRIELGSIAGAVPSGFTPLQVSLTPIAKGWSLGYEGIQNFQDIQLSQGSQVTVSGVGGGDIQVQGKRITLTEGSQIVANTIGSGLGGTVTVNASESVNVLRSGLATQVVPGATGTGANLTIQTRQLLVQDGALVGAATLGSGKGGNLTIQATDLVLVSGAGSRLAATVPFQGSGNGGDLTLDTRQLIVRDGAQVSTSTLGQGTAGNLTVNATEVELVGSTGILVNDTPVASGLFSTATSTTGVGGNLSISANKLIIRDGARIATSTFGSTRAGDVTVRASEIELVGDALSAGGKLLTNSRGLPFPSGIFADTGIGYQGNGGTLRVVTDRLSLRNGAVLQTSTLGRGDAGNLIVQASDFVEVIGKAADGVFPTSLLAVSGGIPGFPGVPEATGRGGDLAIATGNLIVRDGAAVAVSSLNPTSAAKGAGNLEITAQSISLDNQGQLTAATASGNGGDMRLNVQDLLLLRRNSAISTTAGIIGAGGNGGNIKIDAKNGFIVAIPSENSDITANAFTGNGGNVQITAQSVFGTQFQRDQTPLSDITASSRFGINGVVVINTPDVDPSRGLVALPTNVVDASELIASGCRTPQKIAQSEFIVTGRGGLPENPSSTLSSDAVWTDLRPMTHTVGEFRKPNPPTDFTASEGRALLPSLREQVKPPLNSPTPSTVATQPSSSTKVQLVEAQGWMIGSEGKVILTAQAPTVTPHSPELASPSCQSVQAK